MVAERRFGPVIAALFVLLGVLLVRLFQVQVLEHRVWAAEAASLVRSSQLLPSHRGRILDRAGRVLVEDEDVWRVDFVYRDFRRAHPLGILAHARSTLEMRCVPLAEALSHLGDWAAELERIPLGDLDDFAAGKALRTATLALPAVPDAKADLRPARAADLRYYLGALLRVGAEDRKKMREHKPDRASSFADWVAAARRTTTDALLASLAADLSGERRRLAELARLLPARMDSGPVQDTSVEGLIARIETARGRFEDAAADALFERAAGFFPGRLSTATLVRGFDLLWIARDLRWDPARLRAWEEGRRAAYLADLDEIDLPRILVRAGLEDDEAQAGALLDGVAALYASDERPSAWTDLKEPLVLAGIADLFDLPRAPEWRAKDHPALPFLERDFRESASSFDDPWLLLGTLAQRCGARLEKPPVGGAHEWADRWKAIAAKDDHLEGAEAHEALRAILLAFEAQFTATCDAAIEASLAAAAVAGRDGPLRLSKAGLEDAQQDERFLLKDISSRPVRMAADASYELVHLLERDAFRYRGFEIGPATRRRILARDADGLPLARGLLGGVRGPTLREILAEQRGRRGGEDGGDEEAAEAAERAMRADEKSGTSGIEAMFDPELRGRNGWCETVSLDDERSDGTVSAAIDGRDVELTLDSDLQAAAEEALEHPQIGSEATVDRVWLENPVGAIVLLTTDGEVLAAASAPKKDGLPPAPGRDLERTHARERTLTRPGFNPPGSSIKPFLAAYAIDRLGLDPHEEFGCTPLDDGGAGYQDRYGTMHCHPGGHGHSDLARALAVSCNATFAQIGERFRPEQLLEMAEMFGFGRSTGIRHFPVDGDARRPGLLEQGELKYLAGETKRLGNPQDRMRFANGLTVIEATPMQLARAMAGLVSGRLPEVRIVREIAGEPVAKSASDLPISARAREIVLRGLDGVVNQPGGTAYGKGLDRASLGFSFACKTGSADTWEIARADGLETERKNGQKKLRKQTWIVGWFPVEQPKAVLVVLLHDVIETSSHTSVHVAAQFLRSAAVQRFLEGGPEEPPAPENRR